MILLDANILLRMSNKDDKDYALTQRAVFACRKHDEVAVAPQTLFEFWAVATRGRDVNGIGMEVDRARQWVAMCGRMFRLLPDPADLTTRWADIVARFAIKGFRAHDARYVAFMELHRINHF